jgi:antitoxin (DNA-binding transcriptional repressor) of toxin-antitoxin stability system
MKPKTVDINIAQTQLKDLVHQVTAGAHVILSEDDKPVAQLVPVGKRIAGLHQDTIWTSEDFNAPLPEEFWTEGT